MGYLSDWTEAEQSMQAALDAHPDCDQTLNCPANDHLLTCRKFRRERKTLKVTSDYPTKTIPRK